MGWGYKVGEGHQRRAHPSATEPTDNPTLTDGGSIQVFSHRRKPATNSEQSDAHGVPNGSRRC